MVRGAEGDHAPGLGGTVKLAHPQPRDHAAGRVADHVHRRGAGACQRVVSGLLQPFCVAAEVPLAVALRDDDGDIAALGGEEGDQRLDARRRASVAGQDQHRPESVLRHRDHAVVSLGDHHEHSDDRDQGGR
jgi:hypothetical protein